MSLTKVTNSMIVGAYINVMDYGATGDGTTNDTVAIQGALDAATGGGVVYFPPGEYRIARNIGTNDRWGVKVTNSNVTLKGDQAFLRRFNTNITSDADVYPILFVGVPDSNVASLTTNVVVDGLNFIGENTQHNSPGDTPTDFRNAIEFKNTSNTLVNNCQFTAIDSAAIVYQRPAAYDYFNNQYYNTTKNYSSKVTGCSFIATPHAVAGRALIHAIALTGIDFCNIVNNYFEWCDGCVQGQTQYNNYSDTENDTFTFTGPAAALGPLKRCGRNIIIDGNTVYNSSEHCFYIELMDVTISDNNIRTDNTSVCTTDQIKIRGRGISVIGNIISNYPVAVSINEAAIDISVVGNICRSTGTASGGVIDVNSDGLSAFIADRRFLYVGGLPDYKPMSNIVVSGNTITMPDTAAISAEYGLAFRIYTDSVDVNYPNGQIQNLNYSGNTIKGYNVGFQIIHDLYRDLNVNGNSFYAKDFVKTAFAAGTTLNTRAVIQAYAGSAVTQMRYIKFNNNFIDGATYLFATHTGGGTANTYEMPWGLTANTFNYVKNIRTADILPLEVYNRFNLNNGFYFLDRTWNGKGLENSLNDGTNFDSVRRYVSQWDGSAYRFYTDDAGTFVTF